MKTFQSRIVIAIFTITLSTSVIYSSDRSLDKLSDENRALFIAIRKGKPHDVQMLLHNPATNVNSVNTYNQSPLHVLAHLNLFNENKETIQDISDLLLAHKNIVIDSLDCKKNTPLIDALSVNNKIVAFALIKANANVNFISENDDKDALTIAIYRDNNLDVIEALLDAGANKDACKELIKGSQPLEDLFNKQRDLTNYNR